MKLNTIFKVLLNTTLLFFVLILVSFCMVRFFMPLCSLNQVLFHVFYLDDIKTIPFDWTIITFFISSLLLTSVLFYRYFFWKMFFLIFPILFLSFQPMPTSNINEDKYVPFLKQLTLSFQNTKLYKNYQIPNQPVENPKNIILIFMESMEKSFSDEVFWGENLIPELSKLAQNHLTFQGYKSVNGTNWTLASQVATLCGVPLKMYLRDRLGQKTEKFMPKAVCLTDFLKNYGYYTVFAKGCYKEFAGTNIFTEEHHFDEIYGQDELIEKNYAKTDDIGIRGFGINDEVFFSFAKEKIASLSKKKEPFFISLTSLDTHFPKGFVNKNCSIKYNDIRDAIKCSDKIIADFIHWCLKQKFMKDTIIIAVGDHLMMDGSNIDHLLTKYPKRETFSLVIDGNKKGNIQRSFAQFDLGATILNLISNNQNLGIGQSVFSNSKTMLEKYGFSTLEQEVLKSSDEYNKLLDIN